MPARSFFVHPYAQEQANHGVSAVQREHSLAAEAVFVMGGPITPKRRPQSTLAMREMMAETKVTLATHQLGDQVKESKLLWGKFRAEYLSEVKSIKLYVGVDILQQIWRKKVASKHKYKCGSKDHHHFDMQTMKLESCLNQLDEATQLLAEAWWSEYNLGYDSRQHHVAKVRAAGYLVVNLSKKAVRNESACTDLLGELAELEKLIDPKSSGASMLHSYDNRQSQNSTRSGKGKTESSGLDRPDDGDMHNQTEHDFNETGNWSEDNEAGTSCDSR
ncbi:hypothetical protein F4679DRAFT_545744 [Xylaria curta]|nr:hypothetical protein F4679DRAFT_545744 [Xylaria curta]